MGYREVTKSGRIGSALIVVGGSIAAGPVSALELGEMTMHSTLGQPLRASIAYALAPNEVVTNTCVSLQRPDGGRAGSLKGVKVSVANGVISFTRGPVIREPVASFRVSVRCPYTPRLAREYTVLVDPPQMTPNSVLAPVTNRLASRPSAAAAPVARAQAVPRTVSREPIEAQSRYQVQSGDSLSLIAQRIEGAQRGWRELSNEIFDANPDAFIANDPNRLKAGSWLTIPGTAGPVASLDSTVSVSNAEPAPTPSVYDPENAARTVPPKQPLEFLDEIPEPLPAVPRAELRPGDLIIDTPAPVPDALAEAPIVAAERPNESISIIQQPERQSQGPNWLVWLLGGGIAAALALLVFGRRLLGRSDSRPDSPALARPVEADADTQRAEAMSDFGLVAEEVIADDSPTAENPQLDADLIAGTGLSESSDVDVAADFAFAATTDLDLDLELTEAMSAENEDHSTDIIPPINADQSSILESEVLPEDVADAEDEEEEDYDISVVIDATKMPDPADVTERDLEAIAVDDGDESLITGDYTVSQDVDYKILEQDYQDELTATQALNEEIQRAAEDLSANLQEADASIGDTKIGDTDINANASVEDLDVTAQIPANDDTAIISDADDDTVEMSAKDTKAG